MMKLQAIGFVVLAVISAGCLAPQANAEAPVETVADAVTRAIFNKSGDIYRNTEIDRQATFLFGLSYPEHEYLSDSLSVNKIYQDVLRQRASEPVRTADLPNPFSSSLLTSPPKN
jgi:hypothetical protein